MLELSLSVGPEFVYVAAIVGDEDGLCQKDDSNKSCQCLLGENGEKCLEMNDECARRARRRRRCRARNAMFDRICACYFTDPARYGRAVESEQICAESEVSLPHANNSALSNALCLSWPRISFPGILHPAGQ